MEEIIKILPASQDALVASGLHDKIVGCIFGSALGDAVGLYTEFLPKTICLEAYPDACFSLVEPITSRRADSHRNRFPSGHWTDDTDQALLLVLGFIHNNGKIVSPLEFASRLQTWVQQGLRALDTLPLGLGGTVGSAVLDAGFLIDARKVAHDRWVSGGRKNAANGSLMRTHPIGVMCINKSLDETFTIATEISETTHADPRCTVACCIAVGLIRGLARGEIQAVAYIDELVKHAVAWTDDRTRANQQGSQQGDSRRDDPFIDVAELDRHVSAKDLSALKLDEAQKIGYVYKCLGSGVVLLRQAVNQMGQGCRLRLQEALFEDLMTELVMEGGDADTNASFAGALLGTLVGYRMLPNRWREGLLHKDWLLVKAETVSQHLGIVQLGYTSAENADAAPDGGRGLLTNDQLEDRWQRFVVDLVETDQKRKREAEAKRKAESSQGFFGKWR